MKNIKLTLLGTAALLIAVGLNIRHALNDYGVRDNKLHVEVLAQSNGSGGGGSNSGGSGGGSTNGGGGVESCDILLYTRNAAEAWPLKEVKYSTNNNIGLHAVMYGSRTVANLDLVINIEIGGTVLVPDCLPSTGNCCAKSHLDKKPRYF